MIPKTEQVRLMKSQGHTEESALKKLASMKRKPSKPSNKSPEVASPSSREDYPYGLRIDLDNEGLEKIGMTDMPKVGSTVTLQAKAKVSRTSHDESDDHPDGKGPRKSVCLQITHLAVE